MVAPPRSCSIDRKEAEMFGEGIIRIVVACCFSAILAGCLTLPEITERMKIKGLKGKPVGAAVSTLGYPTRSYQTQAGVVHEWYSYRENVRNELVGSTTSRAPNGLLIQQEIAPVTYRYKCLVRVLVDPESELVTDYSVEGNDCRSW